MTKRNRTSSLTKNFAAASIMLAPLTQAGVIADLAADYDDSTAVVDTTKATINTPNGTWEYFSDTDLDPSAGTTLLTYKSNIGVPTPTNAYAGENTIFGTIHNMPAVTNSSLFDNTAPNSDELALHPGMDGPEPGILVIKFTANSDHDNITIKYSFRNTTGGDGSNATILDTNFNPLLASLNTNNTTNAGAILAGALNNGESIYLLVDNGPGDNPGGDQLFTHLSIDDSVLGDITGDGKVLIDDYHILRDNFGTGTLRSQGDLDFDGDVDLNDYNILEQEFPKFNNGASLASAIPEPSSIALLSLTSLALIRRKK